MPLYPKADPTQTPLRLAIFGDSHYACMRVAQTKGLVDLAGLDVEYWGHVGQRFKMLEYRDGAIHPTDDFTAMRFAKFNEKQRRFLSASDFDSILFMGCRIDVSRQFMGMVDAEMRGVNLSLGLRKRMLGDWLAMLPSYGFARSMAALGQAKIYLHPVSLFAYGAPDYDALITKNMLRATPKARANVWNFMVEYMAEDGITLLPQQDHTFAHGVYTDPFYVTERFAITPDYTHRSAAYGALVYKQTIDAVLGR